MGVHQALLVLGFLCALEIALTAPPPQANGYLGRRYNESSFTSGDMNDGRWFCPWYLDWFECAGGDFTCTCPGDNQQAKFNIGCCYRFPECGRICNTHDCSRYENCHSCRSGIGEWEQNNICYSCKAGWALGSGNCRQDIDECQSANGGCEQNCINSQGSYSCSCNDGFQLADNGHDCIRLSCPTLEPIADGSVVPTMNWMYDSYAKYSCNDPRHHLLGYELRRCEGQGATVFWDQEEPVCAESCSAVAEADRTSCGTPGIAETQCNQLGCCYDGKLNQCFLKPDNVYIRYASEKPGDGTGIAYQKWSNNRGCAFMCDHQYRDRCGSYVMQTVDQNAEQGLTFTDCHLLDQPRSYYVATGQITKDEAYAYYDPIKFYMPPKAKNGITTLAGSFWEEMNILLTKTSLGCYKDSSTDPDFPLFAFSDTEHMTALKCIETCRNLGYKRAALQRGTGCFCGQNDFRKYSEAEDCNIPCPGDGTQICGGHTSNSVYSVPYDRRYLGCYNDNDTNPDLPMKLWDASEGKSADACVEACKTHRMNYAGVQEGGACYCGSTFGTHGLADESSCDMPCQGWSHQECGGKSKNAIHRTETVSDMSLGNISPLVGGIYDGSGQIDGISPLLFTFYPGLKNIVTDKLIMYSDTYVTTPLEDGCMEDCYSQCGTIENDDNLADIGGDTVLRFFHFRLSDLSKYVSENTKRVYIYSQTIVVDMTLLDLRFALMLRARHLIVDREMAVQISISPNAPDLEVDLEHVRYNGPTPDLMHQKMSYMCARILIETMDQTNVNLAYSMLKEISHTMGSNAEQTSFIASTRAYYGELYGMARTNLHYVPIYTKAHLSNLLNTYYDQISIYQQDYNRLLDQTTSNDDFIKYAEEMHNIYVSTDLEEARTNFESTVNEAWVANKTYTRMRSGYEEARNTLEVAREEFESGINTAPNPELQSAMGSFLKGIVNVVFGYINSDWRQINEGIGQIRNATDEIVDPMEQLAEVIYQIDILANQADETLRQIEDMHNDFDYEKSIDDIEMTVLLQVNLVRWGQLKDQSSILLASPDVASIRGCTAYAAALMDMCNWGEAVTRSMIERAELLRLAMEQRFVYENRLLKQERIQELINNMKQDVSYRKSLLAAMTEQSYDVRVDLNEALLTFCRAYFYENLFECRDTYKPSFGGSFTVLLLKINAAKRDSLLQPDTPSTVRRSITISDTDTKPECSDYTVCPINYLRKNNILMVTVNQDDPDFRDLDKYRVAEVVLEFPNAKPSVNNKYLKVGVESSGSFNGRSGGQVYDFLTKPLRLAYEYDLLSGEITIHADVYDSFRQIVSYITPFTTWVMPVDMARSGDIDLSAVTHVTMRFEGSAVPGRKDAKIENKVIEKEPPIPTLYQSKQQVKPAKTVDTPKTVAAKKESGEKTTIKITENEIINVNGHMIPKLMPSVRQMHYKTRHAKPAQ